MFFFQIKIVLCWWFTGESETQMGSGHSLCVHSILDLTSFVISIVFLFMSVILQHVLCNQLHPTIFCAKWRTSVMQLSYNLCSVPSRVWTVPSLSVWKFWKIARSGARSNPTARRGRNHLEFFKIFMQTWTELPTLSMGQSIIALLF